MFTKMLSLIANECENDGKNSNCNNCTLHLTVHKFNDEQRHRCLHQMEIISFLISAVREVTLAAEVKTYPFAGVLQHDVSSIGGALADGDGALG